MGKFPAGDWGLPHLKELQSPVDGDYLVKFETAPRFKIIDDMIGRTARALSGGA